MRRELTQGGDLWSDAWRGRETGHNETRGTGHNEKEAGYSEIVSLRCCEMASCFGRLALNPMVHIVPLQRGNFWLSVLCWRQNTPEGVQDNGTLKREQHTFFANRRRRRWGTRNDEKQV